MKKAIYQPTPKQLDFHKSKAKYRLYGGARGGGKSYAMRAEIVRQALSTSGVRILALRRTFPEIYQNMVIPLQIELPRELYEYNEQKSTITFNNGSTIKFGYCRNLKDVMQFQGIEFDVVAVEELTHWNELEFRLLTGSLRTTKQDYVTNFIATTNPGGIGHAWVKRLWVDKKYSEIEDPREYAFIPATVYDNPILQERDPAYIKALESIPDKNKRRAWLHGDWDAYEGQYFPEWNREIHVQDNFIYQENDVVQRVVAIDYGYTAPSAVLWAVKLTDERVYIYRELYQTQLTYKELATKIRTLTPKHERIDYIIGDPAFVGKHNEATGTTGADEFAKVGLHLLPADNERIKGWQIMREYLKIYTNPNTNVQESRLIVSPRCTELIRTLPQQIYDERNVEDMNTKGEDHLTDCLRYGLISLYAQKDSLANMKDLNDTLHIRKEDTFIAMQF